MAKQVPGEDDARVHDARTLAANLWWSWQPDGAAFWESLDAERWAASHHNPMAMVRALGAPGLQRAIAAKPEVARHLDQLVRRQRAYLEAKQTWHTLAGGPCDGGIVYFSAEFGIHESFPIYSGGLGVLAGDHIKSSSDLGLPFVGVGLLYRNGYVRQQLDAEGRQVNVYIDYDFEDLVARPVDDPSGDGPLRVTVELGHDDGGGEETVVCQVWRVDVGRCPLYLMDTDLEMNTGAQRALTAQLYGGGQETRIRQELILGVGGMRAMQRLGISAGVYHLNEGHASFLALERARQRMAVGAATTFEEALAQTQPQNVFTTHTPVEAGHDRFPMALAWSHLSWMAEALGLDRQTFLDLGRWPDREGKPFEDDDRFNMTLLALHTCDRYNGVAALHGEVSRHMFGRFWDGLPDDEVPITHVTNGVHAPSWQAPEIVACVDAVAPAGMGDGGWRDRPETDPVWRCVNDVDDAALWDAHIQLKRDLLTIIRGREARRRERLSLPPWEERLEAEALTIGFARRFATYKRATLLFSQLERLMGILGGAAGPVQFIFAGKAHPADTGGQAFIKKIYEVSTEGPLAGRVHIIEDYDIEIGRAMTRGVDVWLNNPRRPKEASGTSGMKAVMNGIPNLSILDGWWPEGFDGTNGWAIGEARTYETVAEQDAADADSLYRLLGNEVIPMYYERDGAGLPRRWLVMMKNAIRTCTARFHSDRQVQDYVHHLYTPG